MAREKQREICESNLAFELMPKKLIMSFVVTLIKLSFWFNHINILDLKVKY